MGSITHQLRDDERTMGEVSGQFKVNGIDYTQVVMTKKEIPDPAARNVS
jgi:hypothetical protein